MVIEEEVTKVVGAEIGGRMHTGKSRNDQVATALRMRLRHYLIAICKAIAELQAALNDKAEGSAEIVMPGFTHLQHAQPVSAALHLLAYSDMLGRSLGRLMDCYRRVNLSPMAPQPRRDRLPDRPQARRRVSRLWRPAGEHHGCGGVKGLCPRGGVSPLDNDGRHEPPSGGAGDLELVGVRLRRHAGRPLLHEQHNASEEEPRHLGGHEGQGRGRLWRPGRHDHDNEVAAIGLQLGHAGGQPPHLAGRARRRSSR